MLKNLKHSLVFVLIVIILLLVVIMSLAASKPVSINTAIVNDSKYKMRSEIGMVLYYSQVDGYADTLLANGFTNLRIDIPDYQNTSWLANSKAAVNRAVAKNAKVIWGSIFKLF